MVFRALAVLVALPALVLMSPWVAKGAIEHDGQNGAACTWVCARVPREAVRPRLLDAARRVVRDGQAPHFGRDEGHAADASCAGELLRRVGYLRFLWLDWNGEKQLQDGRLQVVLCTTNYDPNT
ncbi:hypothetical protein JB92DRAFT_1279730 [Gautieria morchelliformis]|nr:hypothetical protein JB92DRAFT_1279730 [Gautieria morchelliformis]